MEAGFLGLNGCVWHEDEDIKDDVSSTGITVDNGDITTKGQIWGKVR